MSPRFPFEYAGLGINELLVKKSALLEALEQGSQTSVAASAGMDHEFNPMSYEKLQHRMIRICLALHLLWLEGNPNEDPATNPYPDPTLGKNMKATTVFC